MTDHSTPWPESVPRDASQRYRRVVEIAYKAGHRLLRQRHAAEDLAHEVWLDVEAYVTRMSAGEAEPLRCFDAWVQRVAANKAAKVYRSKWHRILRADSDVPVMAPRSTPAPDEVVAGRELSRRLREAMASLNDNQRRALELYYEGHSYQEIAETMDSPLGSVKVRIHRARSRLAELLRPDTRETGEAAG